MSINRHFLFDVPSHTVFSNTMAWVKAICNLGLLMLGSAVCFYSAIHGKHITGSFAVLALLIIHLSTTKNVFAEASTIIMVGIIGSVIELTNRYLGIYAFNTEPFQYALLPTWIVTFWFVTGAAVRHTFRWLSHRYIIASIMGMGLGTLVYFIASKLNVIEFTGTAIHGSLISSLMWAIAFPVIILIGHRLFPDGATPNGD